MQYKQKNNIILDDNFFNNFLLEKNIQDLNSFLHPSSEVLHDFMKLDNIIQAAQCIHNHLIANDKIFIQIDSDTDGYTSAAIIYLYLKQINPFADIQWRIHDGKQHGLITETIPDNTKLVIAPDSSSNDYTQHKELKDKGIDVVVLDHHMADMGYSPNAIVVNNQLSLEYPNKSLCGAGVVYKFCCAFDELYDYNYANQFIDLAAVGLIGDMMELLDLETRYIVDKGIQHITNLGLSCFIEKQSFSMGGKITPIGIAFYIVPLINALIRVGTNAEKQVLFQALIDPLKPLASTKRGHKPGDTETACAQAVRICTNAKSRQDRLKLKAYDYLDFKIQKLSLDENKIIIVKVDMFEEFDNTLTGLVAMQLVTKYKKPVCVVRENSDGFLRGSARGINYGPIEDLRKFFMDSGYFEYAMGHPNAHGVSIHKDKLDDFIAYANKQLENIDFNENVYEVDCITQGDNPYLAKLIKDLDQMAIAWGQGIEEPLIAIENIRLRKKDIQAIGADQSTVKFTYHGVTYLKFKDEELMNKLQQYNLMELTIIGKANVNNWMGNITPQIFIENCEIKDVTYDF